MRAIGFIGNSGAGKTTLIEKLIQEFAARGLRVSALKHAHHGFDIDRPGKDSFRYRVAGATQVMLATGNRWALLTETRERSAPLDELLARLDPCDLVLVEGFRSEGNLPRIEVRRAGGPHPPLVAGEADAIAIASDTPAEAAAVSALPVFDLNDAAKIADFITKRLELPC
jgi:molybdopterin-guanine dinucleotide biosynthesis protein B